MSSKAIEAMKEYWRNHPPSVACGKCGSTRWYVRPSGGGRVCRDCHNRSRNQWRKETGRNIGPKKAATHRLYLYGLSEKDYVALIKQQEGRCLCCGESRKLMVDHNHVTGVVRGLVCSQCNVAAGMLEDNPDKVLLLLRYLARKS